MNSRLRLCVALCVAKCAVAVLAPLDIPFVSQVKEGCGSAAIAMLIQYWARQDSLLSDAAAASEEIDRMLPASAKGIRGKALQGYLERHGFDAFIFDGEISDLKHHLDKGRPVVVCLAPAGPKKPLHYAVVVGVDDSSVWLNDGARGKLFQQGRDRFMRDWKETGDWALLAVPRPQH